jgi:diguanylate cyclase (GGDEF)-like protein/PAS domain S-box-containing protein
MAKPGTRRFSPFAFWTTSRIVVASVCAASVVVLIGGALYGVLKIESNVAGMYRYNTGPINELRQVRTAELNLRRRTWKMLALEERDRKQALMTMRTDLARIDNAWKAYRAVEPSTAWEKANAAGLGQCLSRFRELLAKVIVLLESGQDDAAGQLLASQVAQFVQLDALLDAGVGANVAQSALAVADSSRILNRVIWAASAVAVALLCGSAALSLYMIRQRNLASKDARYNAWLCDQLVDATSEGVLITDVQAKILRVNAAFTHITGYEEVEVLGRDPSMWSSGRQSAEFYEAMWQSLNNTGKWKGEIWNRSKEGELYLALFSITGIRDRRGNFSHYASIFADITHHKENEERLNYLAMHDALTGLANRNLYNAQLDQAIARAKRGGKLAALMFIDLDGFKAVNDTLGHSAGDDLLIEIGARLKREVREVDTVARLGGDEFAILLEDLLDVDDVVRVAEALRISVGEPVLIGEKRAFVTPSIGISLYPHDARGSSQLLELADQAMYEAKRSGKNTIRMASELAAAVPA